MNREGESLKRFVGGRVWRCKFEWAHKEVAAMERKVLQIARF
jgi:hypothetical protein